jgi:hypothetical protein
MKYPVDSVKVLTNLVMGTHIYLMKTEVFVTLAVLEIAPLAS